MKLSVQKRRRERASSLKRSVSHLKMATRLSFVAKTGRFSAQNGDEIRALPKRSVSHPKMVTKLGSAG
ncbi:hypothetical protein [Caldibacillus thermoamylovorans]|uniref:hypothetical protein n=1 Tax=Caldibacillus thermoamylovorans TaxID=35841 RepID=UPI0022E0A6C1|nr:hypothetical protein [Caldibacillus thermoamylovorans]